MTCELDLAKACSLFLFQYTDQKLKNENVNKHERLQEVIFQFENTLTEP